MTRASRGSPRPPGVFVALAAVALAAVAATAACAGGGPTAKSSPEKNPAAPQASAPSSTEPPPSQNPIAGSVHECIQGQWSLDLDDYTAQSFEYVSAGSPLEELTISGTYTLGFSGDRIAIGSDLVLSGVVYGFPFSMEDAYSGAGDWWPSGGTASSIEISDWLYHGDAPRSAVGDMDAPVGPMLIDPESRGPITVDCRGDSLLIQGEGAPLTGKFVRRTP